MSSEHTVLLSNTLLRAGGGSLAQQMLDLTLTEYPLITFTLPTAITCKPQRAALWAGLAAGPRGSPMLETVLPCAGRSHVPLLQATGCRDSGCRGEGTSPGLNQPRKSPLPGLAALLPFLHLFVHRVHLRGPPEHLILQPVSMVIGHQHLSARRQLFAVAALVDSDEPPQPGCEGRRDRPAGSV